MSATSRAVRAARRKPRPTPAAKLSAPFGDLQLVVVAAFRERSKFEYPEAEGFYAMKL